MDEFNQENTAINQEKTTVDKESKSQKPWATICLICGIVSIVFAWFGYGAIVGIIAGIVGIVFSKKCKNVGIESGQRTAGLVLSVIGIIGGAAIFISCTLCAGAIGCAALFG